MSGRKVYFRADAGEIMGYGHFVRSLALADMLGNHFDRCFFTRSPSAYQRREMEKLCRYVSLDRNTGDEDFISALQGDEIVVLDGYQFSSRYQKCIKDRGCRLVCIDDMHDRHYFADIVINHALADRTLFDAEDYTTFALGLQYALLRGPFLKPSLEKRVKGRWFLSFGGSDFLNLTRKYLSILQAEDSVTEITAVVGDAYTYMGSLSSFSKAVVRSRLSAEEMAAEMSASEFAVLPSSGICIEALACGCKVASGYYVDNQKECYSDWLKRGYILGLDDLAVYDGGSFIKMMDTVRIADELDFSGVPGRVVSLFESLQAHADR